MLRLERYSTAPASPDALWQVVGDPRRLPEWTDADEIVSAPEPPLRVGAVFDTVDDGRTLTWKVITVSERLLEARTDLPAGRLGVGIRVAADPLGARLVLAGLLDPGGSAMRARLLDLPGLRRRFDRWCEAAVRLALRG